MWYRITPAGTIALANLTPIGQNSGQVGCRWPPNGHHLAACLQFKKEKGSSQLWGPFWTQGDQRIYIPLPLPVYCLDSDLQQHNPPQRIFRFQWRNQQWHVQPDHQNQPIQQIGGQYLITGNALTSLWDQGHTTLTPQQLVPLPWQTLTLSHNRRDNYQVAEEGGFYAEMTTLLDPGWSILVKVWGDYHPPTWSTLGAGGTPVRIHPQPDIDDQWLTRDCPHPQGAILLTGALWQHLDTSLSLPYPPLDLETYVADLPIPWQTWAKTPDPNASQLTPGEWLTPPGAVYFWPGDSPLKASQPYPDPHQRHTLGYGHLWLF
ncbi:type III-B CRISPR module-associated Cmr3 family protein [Spirulina sp. CS-785/01]|uniref:type III-B CRISPR module-associated Cmr3 family protein n=1 Tax=Spirulina sp. CS-785/01 TaxID=3021716 RepID=UPI00232EDD84|nr:type III-B CRISPR module-associated Cmr3 family protein [Spirulina sp. CS-785/01]MDB9315012.1 type III-B CRISPR module-associated Cmr3 family protein [Spirulina sp. CS-785/01]